MSAGRGHHRHIIRAEEAAQAKAMLAEPRFKTALRSYTRQVNNKAIIYLAGSDNAGRTVFYDQRLPKMIRVRRSDGTIKAMDPREFLWWHEAVEGVLIRLYGFDYDKAHRFATAIECAKVRAAGWDWVDYSRKLEPFIRDDEKVDKAKDMPRTILLDAYRGTKWYPQLERMQKKAA